MFGLYLTLLCIWQPQPALEVTWWLPRALTQAGSPAKPAGAILLGLGEPQTPIHIVYLHSVERTPVVETFILDRRGMLVLTETRFFSLGAGLPYDLKPAQQGGNLEDEQPASFHVSGLQRPFAEVNFRTYPDNDYRINVLGRRVDLSALPLGSRVRLRGRWLSAWDIRVRSDPAPSIILPQQTVADYWLARELTK